MPQYVGRRNRSVAIDNKPVTNDYLAERGRQGFEKLKGPGHPGLNTRRRFCNPVRHFSCAHTLSLYSSD